MPQFLYRIQPTRLGILTEGPTQQEASIVGEHFEYLQKLVEKGTVMCELRLTGALTTGRHFQQAGFQVLVGAA